MGRKTMTKSDIRTKIEQLENEIKDLEQEKELTNSQEKLDFLDDTIYNTKDSIEKLKKYV
jgi:peptidoglycan hydrolase CwlO-like protein